jgi:tRNA (adenine22-N1)-methyltransferase
LLGLEALERDQFTEVIFNDCVDHVLQPLRGRGAQVVLGRAEDIDKDLRGNVVLAGIGGERIHNILTRLVERGRLKADRLVLCPEKDADWLMEQSIPGYIMMEITKIPHNSGHRWILVLDSICSKASPRPSAPA